MLVECFRSDVVLVYCESAVAEIAVVAGLHAIKDIGVVEGVYRLGIVKEGGVGGMDDAAGGVPIVGPPQLNGALAFSMTAPFFSSK